jgi:hypothetical protein
MSLLDCFICYLKTSAVDCNSDSVFLVCFNYLKDRRKRLFEERYLAIVFNSNLAYLAAKCCKRSHVDVELEMLVLGGYTH